MSDEPKWLRQLEKRVQEAAEKLRKLSEENAALRDKIADLEGELTSAKEGAEAAWTEERDQIRDKVEGLAKTLEGLLED